MCHGSDWIYDWLPNAILEDNRDHLARQTPVGAPKGTVWLRALLLLLLLLLFRLFENWTSKRQMAALQKASRGPSSVGVSKPDIDKRFSTEASRLHLCVRAALTEPAWTPCLNHSSSVKSYESPGVAGHLTGYFYARF